MSDTSNTLSGSGSALFSRSVLSRPGRREVRTTWNSIVAGLRSSMAVVPSSFRFRNLKFSSCEHWLFSVYTEA
jgi:hypothetical protein